MKNASFIWDWIRPLATPYLRGYRAIPQKQGSLRGYWFRHPDSQGSPLAATSAAKNSGAAGFFAGYIVSPSQFEFLTPQPPECLAFVFLTPVEGALHTRLVREKDSLLRKTYDYIRLLTHRPPRFVFHDSELAVMTRHQSMRDWPAEKYQHFSRNFFIETLAWLVRSGIVRKLLAESFSAGEGNWNVPGRKPETGVKKRPQRRADAN